MAKTLNDFFVHQTDAAKVGNLLMLPSYYDCTLYNYCVKTDDSGVIRRQIANTGIGCIIGKLTGEFIDIGGWRAEGYWQAVILYQITLFNPMWDGYGQAQYTAYVNLGLDTSHLIKPENLTNNSEGLPIFYFKEGNTRWTAIEAPVWKDHYSKTPWRVVDGEPVYYLKGKVNYFPDVDPDYLRYGNPKKYDDLWSANLNWILALPIKGKNSGLKFK